MTTTQEQRLAARPVSLGAGSFDYDALSEATNKLAADAPDDRDAAAAAALKAIDKSPAKATDPRDQDGFKWKTVETKLTDGVEVKERRQVFDPELAEEAAAADEESAEAVDRQERVADNTAETVTKAAAPAKPAGK